METIVRSLRRETPRFLVNPIDSNVQGADYTLTDINTVDPRYRAIYQGYNDTLTNLANMDRIAREQAEGQRQEIASMYDTGAQRAENKFINRQDVIRQSAQDAQLSNRIRARAIGGGASSGVLELANRVDRDAIKNIATAAGEYTGSLSDLELKAMQGVNSIRDNLNQTIANIINNKSLSLRERDQAIAAAEAEAKRAAELAAYYNSMSAGYGDSTGQTGDILGEQTSLEIDTGTDNSEWTPTQVYGRLIALQDVFDKSKDSRERQMAAGEYNEIVKRFGNLEYNYYKIHPEAQPMFAGEIEKNKYKALNFNY